MSGYTDATYGDRMAAIYDRWIQIPPERTAQTVACLAALAGAGPALELGIGTGRVALPLAERGIAIHGVDASAAMVEQLRARPGGERIPVALGSFGDLADLPVGGPFSLIYVVFNTLFGLRTQEEQVRCFAGVARHLAAGGVFVVEAFVPDPSRFVRNQITQTTRLDLDHVLLECSRHDPVSQRVHSQQVLLGADGVRLYPVEIRYAWPSELDLMARLAGLTLRERWGDWDRSPFTAASAGHVSVYERISATTAP